MLSSPSSHEENNSNEIEETAGLRKGQWTAEEDEILREYVTKNGVGNWNLVRKHTGLPRCGKSCRLRWTNHLRPELKKGAFDMEEQQKIIQLHALMGNKWARMAQQLPGRTDNEIKNFWNTRVKKRKRARLPLYPEDIQPESLNIDNQENPNASTQEEANDSEVQTHILNTVPELIFSNYNPFLCMSSIPEITEHSTFDQQASGSDNPVTHSTYPLHDSDMQYNSLESSHINNAAPPSIVNNQLIVSSLTNISSNAFQCDNMTRDNACPSKPLSLEVPPLPSFDDPFRGTDPPILQPSFDDPFREIDPPIQLPPFPSFDDPREIDPPIQHTRYGESVYPPSLEGDLFAIIQPYMKRNTFP